MDRSLIALASLSGLVSVALGAFGAHGLKERVSAELLQTWETAARYQATHALATLAAAWLLSQWPSARAAGLAGWCFLGGTLLFSGSLYALVLSGQRWLGAVTPFGGLLFMAGWALLAWAGWRG